MFANIKMKHLNATYLHIKIKFKMAEYDENNIIKVTIIHTMQVL